MDQCAERLTRDQIDLQPSEDMNLSVEEFDEALEAAYGGLMGGSPTLAYGSYCLTCALIHIGNSSRRADIVEKGYVRDARTRLI